ncbi:MAG: hypothetical protein WDW38_002113 [Sanguina aurantia]
MPWSLPLSGSPSSHWLAMSPRQSSKKMMTDGSRLCGCDVGSAQRPAVRCWRQDTGCRTTPSIAGSLFRSPRTSSPSLTQAAALDVNCRDLNDAKHIGPEARSEPPLLLLIPSLARFAMEDSWAVIPDLLSIPILWTSDCSQDRLPAAPSGITGAVDQGYTSGSSRCAVERNEGSRTGGLP